MSEGTLLRIYQCRPHKRHVPSTTKHAHELHNHSRPKESLRHVQPHDIRSNLVENTSYTRRTQLCVGPPDNKTMALFDPRAEMRQRNIPWRGHYKKGYLRRRLESSDGSDRKIYQAERPHVAEQTTELADSLVCVRFQGGSARKCL